jgi:hypothetical protein
VYPLDTPFDEHPRGRCTCIPIVDGQPEPTWKYGPDWFADQDADVQRSMLGAEKFSLYKSGTPLQAFATERTNATWGNSIVPANLAEVRSGAGLGRPVSRVPQWKPSMSRDEAERWAADSKINQDTYHLTPGIANARSIMANGFDLSRQKFGRMWGDGVYVGVDEETAEIYKRWIGPGARKLTIRMNVNNPFVYEPTFSGFNNADIIASALDIPQREAQRIWANRGAKALNDILAEAGYDALHVKALPHIAGSAAGGNQIIVFDPRKVVVINE